MERFLSQLNIEQVILGAIIASVILAFILIVVIFSIYLRGESEKIKELRERLKNLEIKYEQNQEAL